MFDLIIEGGELIDGTGTARVRADLGVSRGKILSIGDLSAARAHERVSAQGRIVAPGFIDVHTHDDRLLLTPAAGAHPKLSQGVTTVVAGNCGVSLAPLETTNPPPPLDILGTDGWIYPDFAAYLDALDASPLAVNVACLVGHSTLRVKYMADLERPATRAESAGMAAELARALAAGAIGLSTGLYYPPAKAATAEEVIAVGAQLKAAGGIVAMHIRDEGDAIDEALREALHIGRELGVATVISHHKLVGTANHGRSVQTLAMLEQAARGQAVCFDCYPYNASSTMLLPSRVKQSSDVLVTWSGAEPGVAGRSLKELARERNQTEEEVARALQPAGAIYFAMSEDDVSRILGHPMAMIGSDGLAHDVRPHPRLWGTFPRVLGHYVREKKLFPLEAAIYKMTGLSARRFGLAGRGTLAPGHHADIVIFDEHRVAANASYEHPTEVSSGIAAVFVNGRLACRDGVSVNVDAGRVLRRQGALA
ncbi:N-acyl-D-amino-acid deacylase family protein [Polaromonas sp. YR568]|uniref:N-acyl-D-amino-acid deacylase family protein n=1 Tax=Polaromonas sp. YR568 TaxID=1855301 RepID=UPI00398BC04A